VKAALLAAILSVAAQAADDAPYEVLHIRGNVYMLASALGNVTVQVGKDPGHEGVLLVDTGSAAMAGKVATEIRELSGAPVRFIVNTSADPDHTGGNEAIAKPDTHVFGTADAVTVFAQTSVLTRMSSKGSGVATGAWPTITFDDRKALEFNGETVEIFSEKSAHTDGDSIVLFRGSNVLSAGDVFLTTGYPVIDLKRGGSIQGELRALNHILELTVPHAAGRSQGNEADARLRPPLQHELLDR
jgi:cyclase